jgi:hypothetical protein
MTQFAHLKISSILAAIILVLACAKQGFPPGGPVDKRPPVILFTVPKSDTTNVPLDTKIEFTFSEAVDRNSVEESIFIAPFPGEGVKYQWHGKELRLKFPEGLLANRTYVITIGTGSKDHRSNPMRESFSLAFATGLVLDRGSIEGTVYGEGRVEGTQVWAYDLRDSSEANPSLQDPIYITQADAEGQYRLAYLALSKYRLFAVIDRDANSRYDPEYDAIGVAAKDVQLAEEQSNVAPVNFRIAVRDTTPPILSAALASDRNHVDIRFSEKVRLDWLSEKSNFSVTSGTDTLKILDAFQDERNSSVVHLVTSEQVGAQEYQVAAKKATDVAGFVIDSLKNNVTFPGNPVPDTTRPRFLYMLPSDSSQLVPLATKIELVFSEAMRGAPMANSFTLADTFGHALTGRCSWANSAHLIFSPDQQLSSKTAYVVTLPIDSLMDFFGNKLADTLFVKRFTTVDTDTLSEISGSIVDSDFKAQGPFMLSAKPIKGKGYDLKVNSPGEYRFENMLPGIYIIQLFRDEDNNGEYSFGEAYPFEPSERFYVYPDSIHVRSRWPNEGNNILLPQ